MTLGRINPTARQIAMFKAMGLGWWRDGVNEALSSKTPISVAQAQQHRDFAPAKQAKTEQPVTVHAAKPQQVMGLDWGALSAMASQCTACQLSQTRKQVVFGVGPQQAPWMVLGEAPGEQEDLQGEPFVGKAGQLLDNMLAALPFSTDISTGKSLRHTHVYIANTLKCRPPGNRNPLPEESAQCAPFWQRQIELLSPKIILATGRFAMQALLGVDAPLGKMRGTVHLYKTIPVVVTYHPAYLLRNPADKGKAWADLCLAWQAAQSR